MTCFRHPWARQVFFISPTNTSQEQLTELLENALESKEVLAKYLDEKEAEITRLKEQLRNKTLEQYNSMDQKTRVPKFPLA